MSELPSVLYTQGHVDAQAAEIDRLRAELAAIVKTADVAMNQAVSWEGNARRNYSRAERAEAAIARVRELCASHAGDDDIPRASVLAALEGEQA